MTPRDVPDWRRTVRRRVREHRAKRPGELLLMREVREGRWKLRAAILCFVLAAVFLTLLLFPGDGARMYEGGMPPPPGARP